MLRGSHRLPLGLAGIRGPSLAFPDAVRIAVGLVDDEPGDEHLFAGQRGGDVVKVDRDGVRPCRVQLCVLVIDEDLDLVADLGRRRHRVDAGAGRAAARLQPDRPEVIQHLERVERGLAHALRGHQPEDRTERQIAPVVPEDVRAGGTRRLIEDVGQGPV